MLWCRSSWTNSLKDRKPELAGFGVTRVTVLLPVLLMLLKTFADVAFDERGVFRQWMDFIGHPITALLPALYTFGIARGFNSKQICGQEPRSNRGDRPDYRSRRRLQADAGGKRGGNAIGQMALHAQISPILLAWLVAGLIHVATGSARVAPPSPARALVPLATMVPGR